MFLSFWNESEQNYVFSPSKELKLMIGDKSYSIHLAEGAPVVGNGEIKPAEQTDIGWVNEKDIISSGTSSKAKPLLGYDKDKNVYDYNQAENAVGRPITEFESQAPADKEIELQIPSLLVGYEKNFGDIDVAIPGLNEEKRIGQEIDLKLQKISLESIKRTSATTAELKFALNTGDTEGVAVRAVNLYSKDVQRGDSTWQGDVCTMRISFDEKLKDAKFNVGWSKFVVKGNWTLKIK